MKISIIVPCRNEAAYLPQFLATLESQKLPKGVSMEVLVAEGASTDRSREILDAFAGVHPWIRIVNNPEKIVPTGLNRLIRLSTGEVIIRMDVHARYADDYVAQCLAVLEETGADNVGGPAQTCARTFLQEAINGAYHSWFGCGGARFHDPSFEGYVDTVIFGCWPRKTFNNVGLFDEELVRNQDDELNLRIVRAGGRIYQSPRIRLWYQPRTSLRALFTQYRQYGFWKTRVIAKHGAPASWRHLVPSAFLATLLMLMPAAVANPAALYALAAICAAYVTAAIVASILICLDRGVSFLPIMPIVLATYHISYGLGFLQGMLAGLFRKSLQRAASMRSGTL